MISLNSGASCTIKVPDIGELQGTIDNNTGKVQIILQILQLHSNCLTEENYIKKYKPLKF